MLRRLAKLHPQAQLDQLLDPTWRRLAGSMELTQGASLEIGCDTGWISIHASAGHPELDCVGVDWDPAKLAAAQRHGGRRLNCTFREMVPEEIRYPEATFDKVIAVRRVDEWQDHAEALREIHRVLKPGGAALFFDADAEGELPGDWVQRRGPWPPDAAVRPLLARLSSGDAAWQAVADAAASLSWSSTHSDRLGFFRRLVLVK